MTDEDIVSIIEIMATADSGCEGCVNGLLTKFREALDLPTKQFLPLVKQASGADEYPLKDIIESMEHVYR